MSRYQIHPRRSDYIEAKNYVRAKHEAGGPRPGESWSLSGLDYYSKVMAAVWGRDEEEFAAAVEHEHKSEQARRPHAFVQKFEPNRRKRSPKSRSR